MAMARVPVRRSLLFFAGSTVLNCVWEGRGEASAGREGTGVSCSGEMQSPVENLCLEKWPPVRSEKLWAVMFYSPRCDHCQTLKPKYMQLAREVKDDPELAVGAIDCTQPANQGICITHQIEGYPTIHAVGGGKPVKYTGTAETDEMQKWLQKVRNSTKSTSGGRARCPPGLFGSRGEETELSRSARRTSPTRSPSIPG
ncbi:unnamed protein product [Polarella glacialis]|uniref:Thioredoxin domain-containing protein n=1 Tax=Polarella glacialis TaxID=89957 RepID=A0A813LUK3_POLGL|nr:unnamed protein product [Polarella glacialis]